ncbi:MAG: carbohydrate kinase [Chloroflexi bacterium]|nr:carbohydrate kinase [Chloroflexota bacterium]
MKSQELETLLIKFTGVTILVIGDYFLDLYLEIDPALAETSLETGLQVHQVVRTRTYPGAAGTVTSNLRALGVKVIALGVIGDDGNGYELKRALAETGVDISSLIETRERFTPTYTKPLRDGRELNRLDIKNRTALPREIENQVVERLCELVRRVDGVIIVDQVQEQNCGGITDRVREEISTLARQHREKIFVAESRERIGLFRDVIVQANQHEAKCATEFESVEDCGAELQRRTQRAVIITVGAEGIKLFEENGCTHVLGVRVEGEIDTVGAGDSVIAGFSAALCAGASLTQAAEVGNLVAAVTIQQIGVTGTASPDQVLEMNRV